MPTKLHKKKYKYNSNITNTNGQKCYFNNMTSCCPHMPVNIKGQYAATENITLLNYMGNTYKLYTCCKMCGKQMTNLSENQFKKFINLLLKINLCLFIIGKLENSSKDYLFQKNIKWIILLIKKIILYISLNIL